MLFDYYFFKLLVRFGVQSSNLEFNLRYEKGDVVSEVKTSYPCPVPLYSLKSSTKK